MPMHSIRQCVEVSSVSALRLQWFNPVDIELKIQYSSDALQYFNCASTLFKSFLNLATNTNKDRLLIPNTNAKLIKYQWKP